MGRVNLPGFSHVERMNGFIGASDDYANSRAVLFGIGMDFTTSYHPGTRFGPGRIREASYGLELFSYHSLETLEDRTYFDVGDVDVVFGDVNETMGRAERVARQIVQDGKKPFMLGGEHLVSLPCVKAVHEKYGDDLVLMQFDAHADLRQEFLGNPLSHATVMRRCLDFVRPENFYQFGIRSGVYEEYEFATKYAHLYPHEVLKPLRQVLPELGQRPVYITIDIDVMDPAYAPGTGTPEPGGVDSREMIDAILAMKGLNVVGFDVVEVAPGMDPSDRTVVLGAKLIREAILAFG